MPKLLDHLLDRKVEQVDGPEVVIVGQDGETEVVEEEAAKPKRKARGSSKYPARLIEPGTATKEDIRKYVTKKEENAGGGRRKNADDEQFFFSTSRLVEFEKMNDEISSDRQFFAWFDAFVELNGMTPVEQKKRGRTDDRISWQDYYSGGPKKKQYLSDWWGGSSYWGGYGSTDNRRMAVALQAVQTTVRVIDNHVKRMRVVFNDGNGSEGAQSYTSYDEQLIVISPQAVLDTKLPEGEQIDITTGFALHEASHAEHSVESMDALKLPFEISPLGTAALIHNLFEDIRIERLTSDAFPGFVGYFEKVLAYLWPQTKPSVTWGPSLEEKLNSMIVHVKFTAHAQTIEDADPALAKEMPWWRGQAERWCGTTDNAVRREILDQCLKRLAMDPATKKEMQECQRQEAAAKAAIQDFKDRVKDAIERMMAGGKITELCPSPGGSSPTGQAKLDEGDVNAIGRLVAAGMRTEKPKEIRIPEADGANPEFLVLRPIEDTSSRGAYQRPANQLVARMRAAFHFRPVAPQWTTRLQRSGSLDEDELWRAGTGDYRVFETRNVEEAPDVSLTLLVDGSGSMGSGSKIDDAVKNAVVIHEVLKNQPGVKVRVRMHTGDASPGGTNQSLIYLVWESGEPLSRMGTMLTQDMGNNYDGYAIGWCVRELLNNSRPNEQKVLIVLADGHPAGTRYGGTIAQQHVHDTVVWAEKQGVDVIQIAIDPHMDPTRQARMFKHWLPFTSPQKLPSQITTLLGKIFR